MITSMSVDEQIDLVALTWLGRGDGGVEDWSELRAEAARAHTRHTAAYLLGIPLLADYLEEAASLFGIECEGQTQKTSIPNNVIFTSRRSLHPRRAKSQRAHSSQRRDR